MQNKSVGKGLRISRVLRLSSIVRKAYLTDPPPFFLAAPDFENVELVANPAMHPDASKSMAHFKEYVAEWQQRCGTSRFAEGETD